MMFNINHCSSNLNSSTNNNNCIISNTMTNHGTQSKDEVDFVLRPTQPNATVGAAPKKPTDDQQTHNKKNESQSATRKVTPPINQPNKVQNAVNACNNNDMKGNLKASLSTLDKLSLFAFSKKINSKANPALITSDINSNDETKVKIALTGSTLQDGGGNMKVVKGTSIARLLGNTYNTKKFEKEMAAAAANGDLKTKFNTFSGGRRRGTGPYQERFKKCCNEDECLKENETSSKDVAALNLENLQDNNKDLSAKAMRTISRGLGKLWWKRSHSVDISTPDPEFKVSYLGNVLTGWAKGEGCVEKQLNTLWRNYTQNNKPDVIMRIKVCASGLKATTRQHGLTEYWANRITHCCAPKNFPRVFCWIYRHEGRKLKHELRCHAVLCSKEKVVQEICNTLKENLDRALREFKREKILKQNARLSLANAAYDNPSLPRRKILLSVGGNNYRPPLERSKSAPKLMAIEEAIGEEGDEDVEETNEPEWRPCCQKDSLYPAMTLGRRRCRRGHSIRRTGKSRPAFCDAFDSATNTGCCSTKECSKADTNQTDCIHETDANDNKKSVDLGSDEDDFEKLLIFNNYDTDSPLAGELLPYFDMQMHKKTSLPDCDDQVHDEEEENVVEESPNFQLSSDPAPVIRPCDLSLGGLCSDDDDEEELMADDLFFRQASILNMLHRNSMRKMINFSMSSEENSLESQGTNSSLQTTTNPKQLSLDSDEGSISSGCETASTVTANVDDMSLKYRNLQQRTPTATHPSTEILGKSPIPKQKSISTSEEENNCQRKTNDALFCGTNTMLLKQVSPNSSFKICDHHKQQADDVGDGSGSECSDESGYVEFQDLKTPRIPTTTSTTSTAV